MKTTKADKIRLAARCTAWSLGIAAAAMAVLGGSNAPAALVQPFTPGDLVVERFGDGTQTLGSSGNTIYFDEITPGGAAVQSIAIPDSGTNALIDSGGASSDGAMTLSGDGKLVCFPGYNAPRPYASSISGATAAVVPRGIGALDENGNYSLVNTSTLAFSGNNIRGAAADGANNFWASGTASSATVNAGIFYFGTASGTNDVYSANLRCVGMFNGNLWYSTGSGTPGVGIWKFPGTPTTPVGNTATKIVATTGSPYNFSVSPDETVIYYTDDSAPASGGGIHKWVQSGGTWSAAYILYSNAVFGLTVDWTTTPATLYATTGSGVTSNSVIKIMDTGASATATTNAVAGALRMYRGLAFAPTNTALVAAAAPVITGISPASQGVALGGTATFTLSGFTGNPIASNRWYKVVGATTNLISGQTGAALVLNNVSALDAASYFAILTNASGSATSSVAVLNVTAGPTISAITPASVVTNSGSTVVFTLTANPGTPAASDFWYKIAGSGSGATTNLIAGATTTSLTLSNVTTNDSAGYFAILTNVSGSATSSIATLLVSNLPPVITGIGPASVTTSAGATVSFTVTNSGTPPFGYQWYEQTATTAILIPGATTNTLTLPNVLYGNSGNYEVVITNGSSIAVTSAVVSLTVTNDPHIAVQPASTYGLLDGPVQFAVGVIGTAPVSYQWYFADASGNLVAPVTDGATMPGGTALVSGSQSATLRIANLQVTDVTNFVVVAANSYGSLTSSVAALFGINTTGSLLALWDFNGPEFTNFLVNPTCVYSPVPFYGVGTAFAVGSTYNPGSNPANAISGSTANSPFSGSADANDGVGFDTGLVHLPNFAWGTDLYPLTGGDKQNGVQFNVSTVGAKNILVRYDSRVSATASDYERFQYTTNGTDWIDYPASSTFASVGTTYRFYTNDLTGFPGVANNPAFGFRVVTEFQSSATYGIGVNGVVTSNYVGTANTYGSGGTVTYDLVKVFGDAITNNNAAPIVDGFMDTNTPDYVPLTLQFTVSDDTTPPDQLTYSATTLNMVGATAGNPVAPNFVFGGSGANRTLTITPNSIVDSVDASPILVTVTDGNGDSTAAWFLLTLTSQNLPPTNSLTALKTTNLLANSTLTIPFKVGDDRTAAGDITYTVASDNNSVVPGANVVVTPNGASPMVTITPAANQLGVALVSVTANDNDSVEAKSTTANFIVMVRPNTNVVAVDYFNYDNSGSLDVVSAGFWNHLSGGFGQMAVGASSGLPAATVDSASGVTENLQAGLVGAPYKTNSGAILYSSFSINLDPSQDPMGMPKVNGTYFAMFNDGSGNTANVEDCLVAATNGAAPGYYRLGVGNAVGATALTAQMFPMDLTPGVNYTVVTALSLTNGFSTLWVNPSSPASLSVTNTTVAPGATNNIVNFELRDSGQPNGGLIYLSYLKVGTSFDAVFPSLSVRPSGTNVIVNWSDPTLGIQATTSLLDPFADVVGATPPYTNITTATGSVFFRFKH